MEIRKILSNELENAINLVWRVFLEYEAPDYTQEGIDEFKKTINDINLINKRDFYGAFQDNNLLGVIATKDITHIALFFVDGKYHKQGIGKELYKKIESLNNLGYFTVNSSLYAHEIYKHLGFNDTDALSCIHGIKFYPMRKELNKFYDLKKNSLI